MYRLEKVYADVIAEDRTVCVGYWTVSELLGRLLLQGMVELFSADGRHEVVRARPTPMPPSLLAGQKGPLRLKLPEGVMTWEFDATHGGTAPTRICRSLDWSVELARARVTARWPEVTGRPTLRGVGYADRVRLTRLPRRLGLSSLRWGRVHLPDETLVFTRARFRSGHDWSEAIRWSDGSRRLAVTLVEIVDLDERVLVEMPGRSLMLTPVRVLRRGPAIDSGRFPNAIGRLGVRALAGPTRETRWLARAVRSGRQSEGEGWAIHERVLFGPLSRESNRTSVE
jgi:hypothetical protein